MSWVRVSRASLLLRDLGSLAEAKRRSQSQIPRPVPAKNAGQRRGNLLGLGGVEGLGQPSYCKITARSVN